MRKARCLFLLFISLVIVSCQSKKATIFKKTMEEIGVIAGNKKFIFVIPDNGCEACIQETKSLFQKYKNDSGVFVVFSNFKSKKMLDIQVRFLNPKDKQWTLDRDNLLVSRELMGKYPLIAYINDGKVKFLEEVLPTNDHVLVGFEQLLMNK